MVDWTRQQKQIIIAYVNRHLAPKANPKPMAVGGKSWSGKFGRWEIPPWVKGK